MPSNPFFTIGHSTQALDVFIARLHDAGVQHVVDVRRFPGSRKYPQYNEDALRRSLADQAVAYTHMAALGGRRARQNAVAPEVNAMWRNASFHNYADHALQPAFRDALRHLCEIGDQGRCALMCAEIVWWRCHRRIIADHLIANDRQVKHILPDRIEDATLTPGAKIVDAQGVVYPASDSDAS